MACWVGLVGWLIAELVHGGMKIGVDSCVEMPAASSMWTVLRRPSCDWNGKVATFSWTQVPTAQGFSAVLAQTVMTIFWVYSLLSSWMFTFSWIVWTCDAVNAPKCHAVDLANSKPTAVIAKRVSGAVILLPFSSRDSIWPHAWSIVAISLPRTCRLSWPQILGQVTKLQCL